MYLMYHQRMSNESEKPVILPKPWVEDPLRPSHEEFLLLEKLRSEEYSLYEDRFRSPDVTGQWSKWIHITNSETGVRVLIHLLASAVDSSGLIPLDAEIAEVLMFSPDYAGSLSGTDLRQIPLQSIRSAYLRQFSAEVLQGNREYLLHERNPRRAYVVPKECRDREQDEGKAMQPLPTQYTRRTWFYALVGIQYDAVEKNFPNENTAAKMIEINAPAAKSTVQRWITKARKMYLLDPARLVK